MAEKTEVVISGVAGVFPECKNIPELEEALRNKVHLITDDDRKWKENYDFPTYCGKAFTYEKFDAMFFRIPFILPYAMDGVTKQSLETSVEAIIDAGVNPYSLAGSQTAVYAVYDYSELELCTYSQNRQFLLGTARTYAANRLSFALNLHGPSIAIQGGNGMTFQCIKRAKEQIEEGSIDAAIVVTSNHFLSARILALLDGMGLAASDGKCCPFDREAHGYAASESCVAFFLQRAKDARRNWATVMGADQHFFGAKAGNFLSLDPDAAKQMLRKLYTNCNVDPSSVGYLEADGSGVKANDQAEADIISDIFCGKRKDPLLIGSIKSNMGHALTAACAAGTVKGLIALNSSKIPANIHLNSPIPELTSKGIKVVTQETPITSEFLAVNAIGQFGHFAHALLKANPKKFSTMEIDPNLPQIILLSSRTENGMRDILDRARLTKITPEFAVLLNEAFGRELRNHMYRGYAIVQSSGSDVKIKSRRVEGNKRPLWWVFSGMGSQWVGMGSQLLHIPIFRDVINRCDKVLSPRGLDIKHILSTDDEKIFDNILHAFVGITAVQIGLVEILRALNLEPDGMVGHSVGELGCAYADKCLTLEQTILAAYARGRASLESTLIKGKMAAVGMSYSQIISQLPESIDVACRNSNSSCTLSGPAEDVEQFVTELKAKGIFARSVNVANIAYHSRYIQPAAPILLKYLKEVIPENKERSEKWISSSVPKRDWNTDLATYSSPEYHTNNLLSPVLFEEAIRSIPPNAVLVEIAPHGLLQAILKRAVPKAVSNVPLTHRSSPNGTQFLLDAIGQCYTLGFEPNVSALYPPVQYPVPSDTPSLQPFVTWDHSECYDLPNNTAVFNERKLAISERSFILKEVKDILKTYEESGSPISPLSFSLIEVWKILGAIQKTEHTKLPVVFENVQIYSKVNLSIEGYSKILIEVMPGIGEFSVHQEISGGHQKKKATFGKEGESTDEGTEVTMILSGKISIWEDATDKSNLEGFLRDSKIIQSMKGTDLDGCFFDVLEFVDGLQMKKVNSWHIYDKGVLGKLSWSPDWAVNLDTAIKVNLLRDIQVKDQTVEPISIQFVRIKPSQPEKKKTVSKFDFFIESNTRHFECNGIAVNGFSSRSSTREVKNSESLQMERLHFVPYASNSFKNLDEFVDASLQIIVENSYKRETNVVDPSHKIRLFEEKYGQSGPLLSDMFTQTLQLKTNNLNVEFLAAESSKDPGLTSGARLSIVYDTKAISHLTSMKGYENAFLCAAVPAKTPIQDVVASAANYGQNYVVIYEQVFGSHRYGLLKKKSLTKKMKVSHVSKSSLDTLKLEKTSENETAHYVIRDSTTNPVTVIQSLLKKFAAHDFRCYILLDNDAPPFSLSDDFYRQQVERDMVVNVLRKGTWGSYLRTPVIKMADANVAQILPLANRVSKDVEIKFIGLNPEDMKQRNEDTTTVLDYAGITSSGGHVIGIAYKDEGIDRKFCLDPVLQWAVPSTIPLHEAATLPSAYFMAHLIIDKLVTMPLKKTALITNGQTPVGMACVSLCVSLDFRTYVTVPDEVAYQLVSRTFPKLPKSRISNHSSEDFYVPLMFGTNGAGASLVVSDLPREQMLSAWVCTGEHGSFINLNEESMEHNAPLPMSKFRASTCYSSISLNTLTHMTSERKVQLQAMISRSLMSGHMVNIPHRILDAETLMHPQSAAKLIKESNGKILLDVGESKSTSGQPSEKDKWTLNEESERTAVIITSAVGKAVNIVKWLLNHGVRRIFLSSLDMGDSSAVREINHLTTKLGATLLMRSAKTAEKIEGVENLFNEATKLGDISTVIAVSMEEKTGLLSNITQVLKNLKYRSPFICTGASAPYSESAISIICDENIDCTHVLDQALTDSDESAIYLVSDETDRKILSVDQKAKEPITDFLPSSLEELDEMGELLSRQDTKVDSHTAAKFIPTTSLATSLSVKNRDVLPIFIIPGLSEAQLRPLISKLMYPCYVAHMQSDILSAKEIVKHLYESIRKVQSKGPYTILGETWSGGIAILLSNLLTDSKEEVSLFLLQGVPRKMSSLIPVDESINECLIKNLFGFNEEILSAILQEPNETKKLQNTLKYVPNEVNKTSVIRSFKAIQQTLTILKGLAHEKICLKSKLLLFEVSKFYDLAAEEVAAMSENNTELVQIDCENYKTMVSDIQVLSTIAEEAPISW